MRPYLAIIKDSFREALASRVLWLLLVAITLFLLVLAPVGIKQRLSTNFTFLDLRDPAGFVELLRKAAEKPEATPAKRVWERFEQETRTDLEKARASLEKNEDPNVFLRMTSLLARELNKLLPEEDLYAADVWKGVRLNEEARDYVDKGWEVLTNEERTRHNRVLLEAAFPDQFLPQPQKSLAATYLIWESPAFPIQQSSVRNLIEVSLAYFLSWIVATIGVLIAIVVTASIIPQMFDPGSLHLLLSKPVNRSFLFLSKFFGGCAFTLLNAGYLLAGIWLILGLRFGIWNVGVLYCIPIFLFIFAIYYAVSALTSVIWRNAIVSVMITVVFWGMCFGVGFLRVNGLDGLIIKPSRIVKIIPADEGLLALNEAGRVNQWNGEERQWQGVFLGQNAGGGDGPMYVGPLFDAKRQQLVGVNSMGQGAIQIPVQLAIGKQSEGWRRVPGVRMPAGIVVEMFLEPEQNRKAAEKDQPGVLVVSTNGIFRYSDVPPRKILGVEVPFGSGPQFVPVATNADLFFNTPLSAALSAESGRLAIYSRGVVYLFAANAEGKYEQKLDSKLDVDESQGAVLAFAGTSLVVAHEGGKVLLLDGESLSVEADLKGERRAPPRFAAAAPFGKRFAIVYQNGKLWTLDVESKSLRQPRVSGQGNIYAAVYKGPGRLLIADHSTRVREYTADTFKLQDQLTPKLSTIEQVYWYGVNPLYFAFPRPGEFGYTMQYALTGKESTTFSINMQMARDTLNPWRPVWNGVIFMVVMLGIACVYIERQEF